MSGVRIAVAGAGLIGAQHIDRLDRCAHAELASVVDPAPVGAEVAERFGVICYDSLARMLEQERPDGVVLATPNRLHAEGGLECVRAGVPVLVEKPIADTVESAMSLVEAGEVARVPVLTGHHRNYSPIMTTAREIVGSGRLGRIVAVVGTALFCKPDDYFERGDGWRRQPGGGPIMINLTHDVNNLLSLAGDIVRVQAFASGATRGFAVEDTAAMVFTFAGGALGTFMLSDTAASPRSWEQTSGEDPSYPMHGDEDCYHIAGTTGSLSVPSMRLNVFPGKRSWYEPFRTSTLAVGSGDPLSNQIEHFVAVIRGEAKPICSGRSGLETLRVVDAVVTSARTGRAVDISPELPSCHRR